MSRRRAIEKIAQPAGLQKSNESGKTGDFDKLSSIHNLFYARI
jgi:hypothetical protein